MSQQHPPSGSSLQPTSFFDAIKTYLLNIDVSAYSEYERELRKIDSTDLPDFGYSSPNPLPTPSVTDCESSDHDSDADSEHAPDRKVINITPRNKSRDYSMLDDLFDSELYEDSREGGTTEDHTTDNENETGTVNNRVPNNQNYRVTDNESLNTIALKFNISPNMLKQLNALSTEIIFPGQSLLVPLQSTKRQAIETVLHPVAKTMSPTVPKKQIYKYPMKRITRFEGSVCGTTLITSNAFMFRAHVSDSLVVQHGQSTYNVSIPLDSVSELLLFESFEHMLTNIKSTCGTGESCEKCTKLKQQALWGHSTLLKEEEEEEECESSTLPDESPLQVKIVTPPRDFDDAFAGSATPESNMMSELAKRSGVMLGDSPVAYTPSCMHEFQGYGQLYSTKKRVNPFDVTEGKHKLVIPSFQSSLDPMESAALPTQEGRMNRVDSDTSLATMEFFKKIDDNTNQMQSLMENANKHEFSIFIAIYAICCTRTHGKPSFQYETGEGYSKAHFWVCVPESDVAKLMDNFFKLCPQLQAVDDSSNCVMRCDDDYWTRMTDVILPDCKPAFVPREVATDLVSEPFSGALNYPPNAPVLLTPEMMGELQPYLPCHIIGIDMQLVYSMRVHGMTLRSLYNHCKNYVEVPCILLIKDTRNYVFGTYLSEGIYESHKFYGSGETFLFRLSPDPQYYFWQGENHYFMMGNPEYFTVGAGDGQFALYIDDMLQKGTSNRSLTFYNDTLSSTSSFDILNVEVWGFTDETVHSDTDSMSSTTNSEQYRGSFYMNTR